MVRLDGVKVPGLVKTQSGETLAFVTPTDDAGHIWHEKVYSSMHLLCCMNCGFVKNLDQPNKPCPGPVYVGTRA